MGIIDEVKEIKEVTAYRFDGEHRTFDTLKEAQDAAMHKALVYLVDELEFDDDQGINEWDIIEHKERFIEILTAFDKEQP